MILWYAGCGNRGPGGKSGRVSESLPATATATAGTLQPDGNPPPSARILQRTSTLPHETPKPIPGVPGTGLPLVYGPTAYGRQRKPIPGVPGTGLPRRHFGGAGPGGGGRPNVLCAVPEPEAERADGARGWWGGAGRPGGWGGRGRPGRTHTHARTPPAHPAGAGYAPDRPGFAACGSRLHRGGCDYTACRAGMPRPGRSSRFIYSNSTARNS